MNKRLGGGMRFHNAAIGAVTGVLVFAAAFMFFGGQSQAAVTEYSDRAAFEAGLDDFVTDDYEHPGYASGDVFDDVTLDRFSDAAMSAVIGETEYKVTNPKFSNTIFENQFVPGNRFYCVGCNSTFSLLFTSTSFGGANGVRGVGFYAQFSRSHVDPYEPAIAFVTLGDGSTREYPIPADHFFGLVADENILSIHVGGPGGTDVLTNFSFVMDDLTVGGTASVPRMVSYETLAVIGDPLDDGDPATLDPTFLSGFQAPVINNSGVVAFGATVSDAGCGGLYKRASGVFSEVLCDNDLTQESKGLNADDNSTFMAGSRILTEAGGLRTVVGGALSSNPTPVPEFFDEFFSVVGLPRTNDSGLITFWGRTDKTGTSGIWQDSEGTLAKLVADEDPAPGLPEGSLFTAIAQNSHGLGNNGDTAFRATTSVSTDAGVWSVDKHGFVRKVLAPGDIAPTSTGDFLTAVDGNGIAINAAGETAFAGTTTNPDEAGIWAERWDQASLSYVLHGVVLSGTTISLSAFDDWHPTRFDSVAINNVGALAFRGCSIVALEDACGIVLARWNETDQAFRLTVVAIDSRIPGAGTDNGGASIRQIDANSHVLNAAGQVAFSGLGTRAGESDGVAGIWGWDPKFGLHRVILAGDKFAVATDDSRLLANLAGDNQTFATTGGADGRPGVLSDVGRLVFSARFEDAAPRSEGLFIATIPGALPHEIHVTSGPESTSNPVISLMETQFSVVAEDTFEHALSYAWGVDCSTWSADDGIFVTDATLPDPIWRAPANYGGDFEHCTVRVTIDDGQGLSEAVGFVQTVSAVPAPGNLVVTPGTNLLAFGTEGGPFIPTSATYLIRNDGGTAIEVRIQHLANWISLSPTDDGGEAYTTTLNPGQSENIGVLLNNRAKDLRPGTYDETIIFRLLTSGTGQTTRRVGLTVLDASGHGIFIGAFPRGTPDPVEPGAEVQLSLDLTDTRHHAIHYDWTSSCQRHLTSHGTFDDPHRANPIWTAPENSKDWSSQCTLEVVYDDGAGGLSKKLTYPQTVLGGTVDLVVTPVTDFISSGPQGGPFFPARRTFLVENRGTRSATFQMRKVGTWIRTSSLVGSTLEPGEAGNVTVSLGFGASTLPLGTHSGTVTFDTPFDPEQSVTLDVELGVNDLTDCLPPAVTPPPGLVIEATERFNAVDLDPNSEATATDPRDGVLAPFNTDPGIFEVGHTRGVTWGVVNSCGNFDTAVQHVTVRDTLPPVIFPLPADLDIEADGADATYVDLGPVAATDSADPDVRLTNDAPSGNAFALGTTIVTWTARDFGGNVVSAEQRVTVTQSLELVAVEAVQVSQDLRNTVPLIEGKSTLVRAYFEPLSYNFTAPFKPVLIARGNGQFRSFLPTNYGGITTKPFEASDRGSKDSSANYLLPDDLTHGQMEFEIAVLDNNFTLACGGAFDPVTSDCKLTVDFLAAPAPFQLGLVKTAYHRGEGDPDMVPSDEDLLNQYKRILAQFPINDIDTIERFLDLGEKPGALGILDAISQFRRDDGCKGFECPRFYYGVALSDGNFGAGGQGNKPGRSSWGAVASGNSDLRFVSGQEIGHNLDLSHTLDVLTPGEEDRGRGPCNAPVSSSSEPFFPYINEIGGDLWSTLGPLDQGISHWVYGWDSDRDRIISPFDHFDTMSYCGRMWPSKFTYGRWREKIDAIFPPAGAIATTLSSASESVTVSSFSLTDSHLLVRGLVSHDTGAVSFEPFLAVDSAAAAETLSPGDYRLRVLDAFGVSLHEVSFDPGNFPYAPTEPGVPHPHGDRSFAIVVPFDPNAFEIRVDKLGEVVGAITATFFAPTVEILTPNGGEVLTGQSVRLEWDAQDGDGDVLTTNVQFSPDGGVSWLALAVDRTEAFLGVDLDLLPGTDDGLFRVVVSDGFLSASDVSDAVFSTPNRPPMVGILTPYQHQVLADGQILVLKAFGNDVEDGALPSGSFTWWSDQVAGPLGSGKALSHLVSDLPVGDHQITVEAEDSDGGFAEASVHVRVLGDQAAAIVISHVAPDPEFLWPPNHKMVPVTLEVSALTLPDLDPPNCQIALVSSNEANNGGSDWIITGPLTVDLRAERSGRGTGREYSIEVECSTSKGTTNYSAIESALIRVPRKN